MARARYRGSAPGSLMILGEHAVLHGRRAIVCAVSHRIRVALTPRADATIQVASALGRHITDIRRLETAPAFRFVMGVVRRRAKGLASGFDLEIDSDFPSDMGLGSSAAVTVATAAVLSAWQGAPTSPGAGADRAALLDEAVAVIREVQGLGSGADAAASVYGGTLLYRADPREVRKLAHNPPLTVVYSGRKEPTVEVVKRVEAARARQAELFESVFDMMDRSAGDAAEAIGRRAWDEVGALLNLNQGLMDAIGVNTPVLAEIVARLRERPGIRGAKISGSGLGDCVIGVGDAGPEPLPHMAVGATVSAEGVAVD